MNTLLYAKLLPKNPKIYEETPQTPIVPNEKTQLTPPPATIFTKKTPQ